MSVLITPFVATKTPGKLERGEFVAPRPKVSPELKKVTVFGPQNGRLKERPGVCWVRPSIVARFPQGKARAVFGRVVFKVGRVGNLER